MAGRKKFGDLGESLGARFDRDVEATLRHLAQYVPGMQGRVGTVIRTIVTGWLRATKQPDADLLSLSLEVERSRAGMVAGFEAARAAAQKPSNRAKTLRRKRGEDAQLVLEVGERQEALLRQQAAVRTELRAEDALRQSQADAMTIAALYAGECRARLEAGTWARRPEKKPWLEIDDTPQRWAVRALAERENLIFAAQAYFYAEDASIRSRNGTISAIEVWLFYQNTAVATTAPGTDVKTDRFMMPPVNHLSTRAIEAAARDVLRFERR